MGGVEGATDPCGRSVITSDCEDEAVTGALMEGGGGMGGLVWV